MGQTNLILLDTKEKNVLIIYGKRIGEKRFKPFDYDKGKFVVNLFHATMFLPEFKSKIKDIVNTMNTDNPEFIFEVRGQR